MSEGFLTDPLWYKNAVIYELHVRSFFDSDNDGIGDFEGLRRKLPYLASLGVNTLWLLPFLQSPLRDDGYDTADYYTVLPVHGTLDDFKAFLNEAHERGMRVITELVLNHTSDQHPWFQEARNPSSPKHDWYVWSETTDRYSDARIIFTDTEVSNWTWDRKAGKYYWHRFFSHQPDLNYDNPEVRATMRDVMFYWFDMGVDGLRLDAVPYLFEREGTNCENLPETIEYIKELRAAIEERYGPGKVLLAEANQWPEDTLPYFAGGAGVQMAFNFPIMPRLFMALRRETRRPLVQMLKLTEDIPEEAQWAIFLRNHDELTLEMVTDEERDYMYNEYAADQRFRINVGIRRRLSPLLEGERRRIELLNALLLSMKGSPVLYYGDEIGMGDDPFLGDRNGVRTPMHWSADKNGGFSRAPHHRLFMPAIDHGPYSFEFVNVEDAEANSHSLLNFMRRILSLRKQYNDVFGRGTMEVLPVENQSLFAFVRSYQETDILVIANLSRFAQAAQLPLSSYEGFAPIELFSKSAFPTVGSEPYPVMLGPHSFYWFALTRVDHDGLNPSVEEGTELQELQVREGLHNLLVRTMAQERDMAALEALLPTFLGRQRWFAAKSEGIKGVHIEDAVRLQAKPNPVYLTTLAVTTGSGAMRYLLPLTITFAEEAETVLSERPGSAVAWVVSPEGRGLLHDATSSADFWLTLFRRMQSEKVLRSLKGWYTGTADDAMRRTDPTEARVLSAEQSNSSALIGNEFFIKLYRRLEAGDSPEPELLEHLTQAGFPFIPQLHGTFRLEERGQKYVMGIVQEALPIQSDGWTYALGVFGRFLDRAAESAAPEADDPRHYADTPPGVLENIAPEVLDMARTLGIRTAEMHVAMSNASTPGIAPVMGCIEDSEELASRLLQEAEKTRSMLQGHAAGAAWLPTEKDWTTVGQTISELAKLDVCKEKIRLHGDYHLGQILVSEGEFFIADFEGEPARPMAERRAQGFALKDVAGMLRSIEYAALSALNTRGDRALEPWTVLVMKWSEAVFLDAYFNTAGERGFVMPSGIRKPFLWALLLEKALYEVRYELNNRPDWTWLPLRGLQRLMAQAGESAQAGSEIQDPPTTN